MSPLGLLGVLLTVLLLGTGCHGGWANLWDGYLNFQCPSTQYAVSSMMSVHDNHKEDRRFDIGCRRVSTSTYGSCYWSNWVNTYDSPVRFTCRSNYFINGMRSYHSNHHEDRIWRFRCCAIGARPLLNCVLTGLTNSYDNHQDYEAPDGHVIKGMFSVHHGHYEDRTFEYLVCKL